MSRAKDDKWIMEDELPLKGPGKIEPESPWPPPPELGNHPGNAKQATRKKLDLYKAGYKTGRMVGRMQVAGFVLLLSMIAAAVWGWAQ